MGTAVAGTGAAARGLRLWLGRAVSITARSTAMVVMVMLSRNMVTADPAAASRSMLRTAVSMMMVVMMRMSLRNLDNLLVLEAREAGGADSQKGEQ